MLAKKYRLPLQKIGRQKPEQIRRSSFLILKKFPSRLPFPRLAIIVSKKTAKLAVRRNYLRRLTFHFAKTFLPKLPIADYALMINKDLGKEELQQELTNLFKKTI